MLKVTTSGLANLEKYLKAESKRHKKALESTLKVRGFKLRNELKGRLKQGYSRTGTRLAPLSFIALGLRHGRIRYSRKKAQIIQDAPLVQLGNVITYDVNNIAGNYDVRVGWTKLSPMWARTRALEHQKGFSRRITARQRRFITRRGAELGKVEGGRTPFFLRRSTKTFRTPARPIVDPFWLEMRDPTMIEIRRDFRAKLAGRRI